MTREEINVLWQQAITTANIKRDPAVRYEFANLILEAVTDPTVIPLYLHPAPSVPEWQPIENAPMLQTVLLAVEFDGPGDWRIKCGSFYSNEWHVFGASWEPTHWMPLPKPPSARSE